MPGIGLKIDPVGEDAANVVLDLNDGTKFRSMEARYPTPDRDVTWASSADTEGGLPANLRYQNRTITIVCRVYGSTASDLQTQLGYLEQKVGRINDGEGATHEYVSPSGVVCIFDLLEASADYDLDNAALANKRTVVTITFTAKPFWRSGLANEVSGVDHVETTLPCVIGVDSSIGGDVPAIGRLVVDEDEGKDQWTLIWGVQSHYYDPSADAALFYEAEGRTPQGGAATAELSGGSGVGKNTVLQSALATSWQSMLSTQASGGGNHLKHIGSYRVFGRFQRPTSNSGAVSVCLQWGEGDLLRPTQNTEKTWAAGELEGAWTFCDLGLVHLDKVAAGTQRWEGRVLAKSTVATDDIYLDYLLLVPVDEGYGTLKINPTPSTPTSYSARDEFDQSASALAGNAAPVGGTWSGAGDPTDFQVNGSGAVQRTEVSDETDGRFALCGTSEYTNTAVQTTFFSNATVPQPNFYLYGVLARYTNTSNWVAGIVQPLNSGSTRWWAGVVRRVTGTFEYIAGTEVQGNLNNVATTLRLALSSTGNYFFWVGGRLYLSGNSPLLDSAGALKTGKIGLLDWHEKSAALTRFYDDFFAFVPTFDAAVFASQSADVRSDRMLREGSAGTLWVPRKDYKGTYFKPPPARREARSVRSVVKLSRGNTDLMPDPSIDNASFRIFWQARGLVLPES